MGNEALGLKVGKCLCSLSVGKIEKGERGCWEGAWETLGSEKREKRLRRQGEVRALEQGFLGREGWRLRGGDA